MADQLKENLEDARTHLERARSIIKTIEYPKITPRRIRAGYENGYFVKSSDFMSFEEVHELMDRGYKVSWGINYMIKERR